MIFKLSTATAAPLTKKTAIKKPTEVSNGQLTGLAKSLVEKEAQPKPLAAVKPIETPKVDLNANKNDASLALGKLNPDIKAQELSTDKIIGQSADKQRIDTQNNSPINSKMLGGLNTSPRPGISDVKDLANKPVDSAVVQPPNQTAADTATGIVTPPAEEQRPDTNLYSDVTAAPATTDVGLKELPEGPMGVQTDMQSTIETARTALDKMLNEGADPALRAEAEATLREAEAASVKDTRKSQALGATGLSGAGGRLEGDVRKLGKRETVLGMDEYDRAARQEQAARMAEGLGLQGDIQRAELERLAVERARKQLGTVEESANGTLTEKQPDGSSRVTQPNGDVTVIKANGDKIITHPDGSEEMILAAKTQVRHDPTEQSVVAHPVNGPDQQFEIRYEPGNATYEADSGTYTDAEGRKFKLYTDRNTGYKFLVPA